MMGLIFTLIVLALGVWLGVLVHHDSGYVLVAFQHWTIESSIWVAILALVVSYLLLYAILRFIVYLFSLSARFQHWSGHHRSKKSQRLTQQGLSALAQGQWKKAEQALIKATYKQPTALINYLAAARAANEQGAFETRDQYLKNAHDSNPSDEMAIGLTQAQLQLSAKQWELALATLRHLQQIKPNHAYVLKLLKVAYIKLADWDSLKTLLPLLKKHKVFSSKKLSELEATVYGQALQQFKQKSLSTNTLQQYWRTLPRSLRHNSTIVKTLLELMLCVNDNQAAESVLDTQLQKSWDIQLVLFIPEVAGEHQEKWLKRCESWLNQHGNSAELLYALGKLCENLRLWGKARDYLEHSIELQPQAEAYYSLGRVFEALGDHSKALYSYKHGLQVK
jgi:HemY protein